MASSLDLVPNGLRLRDSRVVIQENLLFLNYLVSARHSEKLFMIVYPHKPRRQIIVVFSFNS